MTTEPAPRGTSTQSASGAEDNHPTDPAAIIAQAVNRAYGYDLFHIDTGEGVLAALEAAGYTVQKAAYPLDDERTMEA